jgi:hypothetical protein
MPGVCVMHMMSWYLRRKDETEKGLKLAEDPAVNGTGELKNKDVLFHHGAQVMVLLGHRVGFFNSCRRIS